MADIFISYSHEDQTRVKMIVDVLEGHGWSVFWDLRIPAGETWRSYIGTALEDARCIIVTWSTHSIRSQWVSEEAEEGKSRGILIPVLLDPVLPPLGFRELQAVDLSDLQGGQRAQRLDQLIADLERHLGKQPKPLSETKRLKKPSENDGKNGTPSGWKSILNTRAITVTLVFLLTVTVVAYFTVQSFDNHKPPPVPPPLVPPQTSSAGNWLVVAGSFPRADDKAAEAAKKKRDEFLNAGLKAIVIDTNEYPLLTQNLRALIIGPFESRDEANSVLPLVRKSVPDAYVKQGR
jgi:hypothetical protein